MSRGSLLPVRCRTHALLACAIGVLALLGSPLAHGQTDPLTEVDQRTEVRGIGFRFVDTQTFPTPRLREQIAHSDPGRFVALRRALSFLPVIPPVGTHSFRPVDLARDAVRLERFYQRNGFLFPDVDWLVRYDEDRNEVAILFTIREGPPLQLQSLDYRGPDGRLAREHIAPELRDDWERFKQEAALQTGDRLDQFRVIQLEDQALSWVRDRGYAFAQANAVATIDTLANRADVVIFMDPGPRARVSEIIVEGNEMVDDHVVLRELPFTVGDRFSQRRLTEGQREVFGLNVFTIAIAEVPEQPVDSLVTVRVRVRERSPRAVTAQTGYLSEGGITGQADWTHRNFLGGARTFTASVIANTGLGAFVTEPDRRYRSTLSLRQPYFFDRRLSITGSVFAERRDDFRDRSRAFGGDATLLFERGQFRTVSASYSFEDRRVEEFRFGTGGDTTQVSLIEEQLNLATAVTTNLSQSVLSLNATYGSLDNPFEPTSGFLLRPAVRVALPFPAGGLQYTRLRLAASHYLPIGNRMTLATRAGAGRLFPAGASPQGPAEAFTELLRLRDVVLLAGGPADVRGWRPGSLGPKALDLIVLTDQDETTLTAARYFPFGGTMRLSAGAELRFGLGETLGTFIFLDAGRVSTPESAYQVAGDGPIFDRAYGDIERVFFGTGGGISLASPVGAIRVALGYKVNPSFFDVRDPQDIAEALQAALRANPDAGSAELIEAARTVEPSFWRRLHLHLSIGQTF